jgi:hypothetical protein
LIGRLLRVPESEKEEEEEEEEDFYTQQTYY